MSKYFTMGLLLISIVLSVGTGERVKREDETEPPPVDVEATEENNTPAPVPTEEGGNGEQGEPEEPAKDAVEPTSDTTGQINDTEETKFKDVPKAELTTPIEWIDKSVKQHNSLRALHKAPPLTFNNELSEIAQSYANEMAKTGKFAHSEFSQKASLGENLFYSSNSEKLDIAPETAVLAWYEEIKDYNFSSGFELKGKEGAEILHFTQLVWIDSKEMGTAFATTLEKNAKGLYTTYVVANYFPRGNFNNFLKNVLPLDTKDKGKMPEILADADRKDGLNDLTNQAINEIENALEGSSNRPLHISIVSLTLMPLLICLLV